MNVIRYTSVYGWPIFLAKPIATCYLLDQTNCRLSFSSAPFLAPTSSFQFGRATQTNNFSLPTLSSRTFAAKEEAINKETTTTSSSSCSKPGFKPKSILKSSKIYAGEASLDVEKAKTGSSFKSQSSETSSLDDDYGFSTTKSSTTSYNYSKRFLLSTRDRTAALAWKKELSKTANCFGGESRINGREEDEELFGQQHKEDKKSQVNQASVESVEDEESTTAIEELIKKVKPESRPRLVGDDNQLEESSLYRFNMMKARALKSNSALFSEQNKPASCFTNQAEVDWHSVSDLDAAKAELETRNSYKAISGSDRIDESTSQQVVAASEPLSRRRPSLVRFSETNSVLHLSPPQSSASSDDSSLENQQDGVCQPASA